MNQTNIALNAEDSSGVAIATGDDFEIDDEAYAEGVFFASTDWQWALKEDAADRPASMAEHLSMAWAFISGTVCPEWNNEHARISFYLGYEDMATELADDGEAGYEALAEAGTVAATDGWLLQSGPWKARASDAEKVVRSVRAAWAGATRWQALAAVSGSAGDRYQAEAALIRADVAGQRLSDDRGGATTYSH
ncbi:hypothetical protein [Paraburkholderia sp. C35]|uniref:hypothetical protein n=1 Tax=Paraburkholderia sp. C35 TaxID=2126993 RepID=UPI000D697427|nr:hypothetical protein [Paraburkholderia sp. C35]